MYSEEPAETLEYLRIFKKTDRCSWVELSVDKIEWTSRFGLKLSESYTAKCMMHTKS